jgi:hypothetical protein
MLPVLEVASKGETSVSLAEFKRLDEDFFSEE